MAKQWKICKKNQASKQCQGYFKIHQQATHIPHKIFSKNYAPIHVIKPLLTLKKLIHVGFTVLEISKCMTSITLLFTDTDSLTYEIKSEDVYEEIFKHKHLFDFSNYPKYSKLFDETTKKVIG